MANKKLIDWDKLNAILYFHAPLEDAADLMGVSDSTLSRRIKEEFNLTFEDYRHKKGSASRQTLRQLQLETAQKGNVTMQIWLGKQWLGQKDKQEIEQTNREIKIVIDEQDRLL